MTNKKQSSDVTDNRNNRILILVDHKHRDMPSLALIAMFLREMGNEVRLVALWQENDVISQFDPGYLVLPRPIYDFSRLVRFRKEGRKIIIINSEGNAQDLKHQLHIPVPPDLFFFWNAFELEKDRTTLEKAHTTLKLIGCARTDFLHPTFKNLYPNPEELKKRWSLPLDRKIITIATSSQDSDLTSKEIERRAKLRQRRMIETAPYENIVANMRSLRALTEALVRYTVKHYPDFPIIIKPHPNENIKFWKALVDDLSKESPHIRLLVGEPINHLLLVSNFHISHNVCTTTIESMLMGIAAVELQTEKSYQMYKKEHLEMGDYLVHTLEDYEKALKKELLGEGRPAEEKAVCKERLYKYVEKYYYKFDGLRSYSHAVELDKYMRETAEEVGKRLTFIFHSHPEYIRPYAWMVLRNITSATIHFLRKFKKTLLGRWKVVEGGKLGKLQVDERGRYDNRIKPGDEGYWLNKFEQARFKVEDFEDSFLSKN